MKVILFDIDTLRADHMGCYGYGRNTTPVMDQIAKEESSTILPTLMSELEHSNVQILTSAKLSEINDHAVIVEKTENEKLRFM